VHLTRFDWIAGLCGIGSYARSDADTQRRHDVGLHTFRMSRTSFFGTECLRFQGQHFLWRSHASIEKWIVPGMTVLLARSTALCSGRCSLGRRCLSRQLRTALSVSLNIKELPSSASTCGSTRDLLVPPGRPPASLWTNALAVERIPRRSGTAFTGFTGFHSADHENCQDGFAVVCGQAVWLYAQHIGVVSRTVYLRSETL